MYVRHEIQQITVTCGPAASKLGLSATNYSSPAAHKPPSMRGKVRLSLYRNLKREITLSLSFIHLSPYDIRQISYLSYKVPLTFKQYERLDRAS